MENKITEFDFYIGTPYSVVDNQKHIESAIQQFRFEVVNIYTSALMNAGYVVYSPISHSHPIAQAGGLPTDWEFWKHYDEFISNMCRNLIVMMLPGWINSSGLKNEIELFKDEFKNIIYCDPIRHTPTELVDFITRSKGFYVGR